MEIHKDVVLRFSWCSQVLFFCFHWRALSFCQEICGTELKQEICFNSYILGANDGYIYKKG